MAPPKYSKVFLRQRASWIRDELDPRIARDGPDCMQPDDVLTLNELFLGLQVADLTVATLRFSRIHMAVLEVAGKATRWPKRLCDECDKIIDIWTRKYGQLCEIRPRLFKPDGRLYGICTGRELTRNALIKHWQEQNAKYASPDIAMHHGNLGFKRGDWWINGMFAFHAGIISLDCTDGGICANKKGAYAVVLKGNDEAYTESPDRFKYRCRSGDPGRFRMTSADFMSRYPIRVLRSHTLNSMWAPSSGLRYEGLFKICGWTVKPTNPAENNGHGLLWEVQLERSPGHDDEQLKDVAMKRPLAEETDDYLEYKRIRKEMLRSVRDELVSGIAIDEIPPTPPLSTQEKRIGTIQSPPMSPTSERPQFDYNLIRDSTLAEGPDNSSPMRMPSIQPPPSPCTFLQPPPSPCTQPSRERPASPHQNRNLTVPQNIRRSLPAFNADARAKKNTNTNNNHNAADGADAKPTKDSLWPGRETRSNTIARSLTRIFSDGAADSPACDIPESPFGSISIWPADHDSEPDGSESELSSYAFDHPPLHHRPGPGPSPLSSPRRRHLSTPSLTITTAQPQPSTPTILLRQPQWGTTTSSSAPDGPTAAWTAHHLLTRRRRDRAVYEAFAHQNATYPPDPRLVIAALHEVWHDAPDPEYPDMVLEESAYERAGRQGYSFGRLGGRGGSVSSVAPFAASTPSGFGMGGGRHESWSTSTSRVSPRGSRVGDEFFLRRRVSSSAGTTTTSGADVRAFVRQLQAQLHERQLDEAAAATTTTMTTARPRAPPAPRGHWAKRSWSSGDGDTRSGLLRSHHGQGGQQVAWRRLSTGGAAASKSSNSTIAARRRSASVVESTQRSNGANSRDEDAASAAARFGNRSRRPTIVRFSNIFKSQSLDMAVDEGVDEGVDEVGVGETEGGGVR